MLTIPELLSEYPQYEKLIISALAFLDEREASWNLDQPINRVQFINDLVEKAMVANKDY